MTNALGDRCNTNLLTANQLGTPSDHIAIAYIDTIIPAPPFNEDLQVTCAVGNTTDTGIIISANDLQVTTGDVLITAGKCVAGTGLTATTGDIAALAGNVTASASVIAGTTMTAGTGITATAGNIVASAGDIETTAGNIKSGGEIVSDAFIRSDNGNILAVTGDIYTDVGDIYTKAGGKIETKGTGGIISASGNITATAGDIVATAGKVTAGANMVAGTDITAGTGITITTGDLTATTGGVQVAAGFSKLNRVEYNTYYGGSTYAAPIALTNVAPYVAFTLPVNTFTFVLFYTHAAVGAASFPFELHTSLTDVLKDYSIIVSSHTADNNGGQSLGYNNIVSGDSVSAPADKSKITIIINTSGIYAAQTLKAIVQLVYSPSP